MGEFHRGFHVQVMPVSVAVRSVPANQDNARTGGTVDAGDVRYEIRVEGDISERWAAWLGAAQIAAEGGESVITAAIQDQSALHGVLNRIRDLGLCLISVRRID